MTNKLTEIQPYIDALQRVSNLDENQAKTLVYYSCMVYSDKPRIRPILFIQGESGCGKSELVEQLRMWLQYVKPSNGKRGCVFFKASNKSPADIRDQLADTTVAIIDEIGKAKEPIPTENWLQLRYDEKGKNQKYRRGTTKGKDRLLVLEEYHDHFGYTIVAAQTLFELPETDRRTLRVDIDKDMHRNYEKANDALDSIALIESGQETDWDPNYSSN